MRHFTLIALPVILILGLVLYDASPGDFPSLASQEPSHEKCITPNGRIYYGDIPAGVLCKKVESVNGAITVTKSVKHATNLRESSLNNIRCDGRMYCSQMTSCKEATFFNEYCLAPKWMATVMVCRVRNNGAGPSTDIS